MRSEWEEKAYIKPHSSSELPTLETETQQLQQTHSRASLCASSASTSVDFED